MKRTHARGEQGVAILVTGLLLIPLMIFAAYGVDVASWYARTSYLQKSADAAALAGTVWMPDLDTATDVACDSLEQNGITGGDCGAGPFGVDVDKGSTPTALLVSVTDPNATRYFSQVLGDGDQALTRSAEAEYNLPIPLGSPLNYFGGDASRTVQPIVSTHTINWPRDYATRAPVNTDCDVGATSAQGFGGWSGSPATYNAAAFSGLTRCEWTVLSENPGTESTTPPPDHTTRAPSNNGGSGCRVQAPGPPATTVGQWQATFSSSTTGTAGLPDCSWPTVTTVAESIPAFYDGSNIPPGSVPTNRPCRVGYETSLGWWGPLPGGAYSLRGVPTGGLASDGNQLCRWTSDAATSTSQAPNPIAANRDPGFWASISGPGGVATQGNAYSVRCTFQLDTCSSANENTMHRDTGFWYVVKMPASGASTTQIRLFDASFNKSGRATLGAGDSSDDALDFDVEYRVFQQTNPLDFNARVPTPGQPGAGDANLNSCWWKLAPTAANVTTFGGSWQTLCTLNANNDEIYLVNVNTSSSNGNGAGVNSYALEATSSACALDGACQPSVYAFGDMGMYNNIDAGLSTFYLAEVGPQFAGKTLVVELWDSGDANGVARMTPQRPSAAMPKPVVPVPASECSYGADTPNPRHGSSQFGGATSPAVAAGTSPLGPNCTILTANQPSASGTPRVSLYNDEWLTIKVDIPADYSCTLGANPETTAGSCWWGIEYDFSKRATDVTTWRARIEGNPVHLTT